MSETWAPKKDRTRDTLLVAVQTILLDSAVAGLSVGEVTRVAGVAHGTFYNHFDSLDDALNGVGLYFLAEHSRVLDQLGADSTNRAEVFALSTRQTLRIVVDTPEYGRLLFDSGIPVDRLAAGLRSRMQADICQGIEDGSFRVSDAELTVGLVAGAILGLTLDLYRGRLGPTAIEPAAETLLHQLGVGPKTAHRLAFAPHTFMCLNPLPLSALVHVKKSEPGDIRT